MQTAAKEALLRSQFIAGLPANTAARTLAIAKSEDLQVSLLSLLGLVQPGCRGNPVDLGRAAKVLDVVVKVKVVAFIKIRHSPSHLESAGTAMNLDI
ncbi:hypothetical protein Pmar_PMAR007142 [Perkinsus marinus ATCC 50983]|uniref:Uncharacterized protein n=1 Tax=Perkinsus marinus (strain ATCC 50983 / TXsc) TaxID=423536 RepID=C5KQB4_PERM5|nr:hypothetical protein Pmar_PMAR007142 [Perkinsus marinus ATCC 50983]EER13336.1 hypothetical protein Pmar_PMAR007142 [Perkinsus marinus ATCC 50983]|eukprot:XP_002781541.1 hypothetical protein Pmar_PMAR007142 [Perkinsus marinus ATCC 50983]